MYQDCVLDVRNKVYRVNQDKKCCIRQNSVSPDGRNLAVKFGEGAGEDLNSLVSGNRGTFDEMWYLSK